ncbi:hypothetical protein FNV43_RR03099 [Rhamnella rubrinervis]|uniref:Non-specific lipid-transfer protein n=1 Tax=Rhamnella rubrinervis TaxID=2594499 RepID=A0A8K0HHR4_9ROSA|nr:hypothetical protein FNV43_RR03099 [Rhamnella rubrinervis]
MAVGAVLLVAVLVISNAPASEAALTCSQVVSNLRPCVSYLVSGSGKPPAACCSGVVALASAASSSADKKTACECIKSTAKSVNPKPQLAQSLPANCGISLPFPVSPNTDCSKVG